MSNFLRVPNKAAINVFQGVFVGTSCALLLLTDDRIRHIGHAKRILKNVERLKSAKQYHSTAAAERRAIVRDADDGTDVEAALLEWRGKHRSGVTSVDDTQTRWLDVSSENMLREPRDVKSKTRKRNGTVNISTSDLPQVQDAQKSLARPPMPHSQAKASLPTISPVAKGFLGAVRPTDIATSTQSQSIGSSLARLAKARATGSADEISTALSQLRSSMESTTEEHPDLVPELVEACRLCSELERPYIARRCLSIAINTGKLDEALYWAFEPLPMLETIVLDADSHMQRRTTRARTQVRRAVALMLPDLRETPTGRFGDFNDVSTRVLRQACTLGLFEEAQHVFERLSSCQLNPFEVTGAYIGALCEVKQYESAIHCFETSYCKLSPTSASWQSVGNHITDAVTKLGFQNAPRVTTGLLRSRPEESSFSVRWAMRMLHGTWSCSKDFEQIVAMFEQILPAVSTKTRHWCAAYCVMVQIALEADKFHAALSYANQIRRRDLASSKDVRIVGYFALYKARKGDWNGVRQDFARAKAPEHFSKAFVSILKEYVKTHTMHETEAFVEDYVDNLGVPVSDYMVTLLANRYGSMRDVDSLIKWLEYCGSHGFRVDIASRNSILDDAKRRWDFSPAHQQRIAKTLSKIGLTLKDVDTKASIVPAVTRISRVSQHGTSSRGSLISASLWSTGSTSKRHVKDVFAAMHEASTLKEYVKVMRLYPLADRYDARCLKLAVIAAIRLDTLNSAITLIEEAHKQGEDVRTAALPVIDAQLGKINVYGDRPAAVAQIRMIMDEWRRRCGPLFSPALNRAAALCFRLRSFKQGLAYAQSALYMSGHNDPDTVVSFWLLLRYHACILDVQGVQWALQGMFTYDYAHKKSCLSALRDVRRLLNEHVRAGRECDQCRVLVDAALAQVRERRARLIAGRERLEQTTIRIMTEAAAEARNLSEVIAVDSPSTPQRSLDYTPVLQEELDAAEETFEALSTAGEEVDQSMAELVQMMEEHGSINEARDLKKTVASQSKVSNRPPVGIWQRGNKMSLDVSHMMDDQSTASSEQLQVVAY